MDTRIVASPEMREPSRLLRTEKRRNPWVVWIVLALATIIGSLTNNPILTPVSLLLLLPLIYLAWRQGEPPALMFACAMQWLQAAAAIYYTNFFRSSLAEAFGGMELETATWLSLCGVFALAVGMRLALFRAGPPRVADIVTEGHRIDIYKAFIAYVVSFTLSLLSAMAATRLPSLSQPLLFIGTIKWVIIFMLGYCVLEQRKGYILLGIVVIIELVVGVLGFFASFKGVFFVLLVALITSPLAWRGRRLVLLCTISVLLALLGSAWTAVKSDYREFLNQGFQSQEVLVPVEDRVGKLQDLLNGFDAQELAEGFQTMILRVSYVQFFALTMKNVPANIPYEDGALWVGAVKHVLTPRILFPNKPAIDDSERTSLYTGLTVAGAEQGTSIGIGYFGESYIDFGPVFMFLPILLVGIFYGTIYRCFVIRARYKLLGGAVVTSILVFNGSAIETSNIKVLGSGLAELAVLSAFYFTIGPWLMRWLSNRDESAPTLPGSLPNLG
jgi:hypothetical protein